MGPFGKQIQNKSIVYLSASFCSFPENIEQLEHIEQTKTKVSFLIYNELVLNSPHRN
jgi:hypothetical protein